jgi:hypothetical protein
MHYIIHSQFVTCAHCTRGVKLTSEIYMLYFKNALTIFTGFLISVHRPNHGISCWVSSAGFMKHVQLLT